MGARPITIGVASAADVGAITGIINRAYEVEAFFKIGERTDEAEIAEFMASDTFLTASGGEGVVGTVRVSAHGSEGHFGMLAVDPPAQGRGIARLLIDAAESWARERGCQRMSIEVVNLRQELPPFYRQFGYEVTGAEPWPARALHRISQPAHFIIMSKQLAQPVAAGEARR